MKLEKVTITGADDSIRPEELIKLSQKYPFVEWGILVSKSQTGGRRFPSLPWIARLNELKEGGLNLSMHVCGKYVRDILQGEQSVFHVLEDTYFYNMFERMQLNTHGQRHNFNLEKLIPLLESRKFQYIFQIDNEHDDLIKQVLNEGINACGLFDVSHGAGVLPTEWPNPAPFYCGYSGGLGPENLEEELMKISRKAPYKKIWVDMETRVRSDNDQLFDLEKVEACLKIAAPHIVPWTKNL